MKVTPAIISRPTEFTERDQVLIDFPQFGVLDSFSRLKVSDPLTLFDLTHLYDAQPWSMLVKTSTGGSITHLPNEANVRMNVNTTTGAKVIRQSRRYMPYQPGKALEIMLTGVPISDLSNTSIRTRMGYFDDVNDKDTINYEASGNGVFLEISQGKAYFVLRSYTSGSQVDTRVPQENWLFDNLSGLGGIRNPSGIVADWTKTQLLSLEMQWLGVGVVVCSFYLGGSKIVAHAFTKHVNVLDTVYMTRASLPIRYEIERVSAGAAGYMKHICSTAISHGGYSSIGRKFSADSGGVTKAVDATEIPLLSVRLKPANCRATINPLQFSVTNLSNGQVQYYVYMGQHTLTGANWQNVNTYSLSQFDITASAIANITNSIKNDSDYVTIRLDRIEADFQNTAIPGCMIDGTPDIITITAKSISATNNILCTLHFQEWY